MAEWRDAHWVASSAGLTVVHLVDYSAGKLAGPTAGSKDEKTAEYLAEQMVEYLAGSTVAHWACN